MQILLEKKPANVIKPEKEAPFLNQNLNQKSKQLKGKKRKYVRQYYSKFKSRDECS